MEQKKDISIGDFSRLLDEFDEKRSWIGLDPADLAKSVVLEAAELLEHYQWDNTLSERGEMIPTKNKQEIAHEAADVLIYLLKFCREEEIDIVTAALDKLKRTEEKYPADYKSQGGHEEYERLKKEYRKNH